MEKPTSGAAQNVADLEFQRFLYQSDINALDPRIVQATYHVEAGRFAMMNQRPFDLGGPFAGALPDVKCSVCYSGLSYDLRHFDPRHVATHEAGNIVIEFAPTTEASLRPLRMQLPRCETAATAKELLRKHSDKAPGIGYLSDILGEAELFATHTPTRMMFRASQEAFYAALKAYIS